MTDLLKFSEEQLSAILEAIKPSIQPDWSFQKLLTLVQIIAIVFAGGWALKEYISYKKEYQKLELKEKAFTVAQQEISRKQQELSVEITRLSLKSKTEGRLVFGDLHTKIISLKSYNDGSKLYRIDLSLTANNSGEQEAEVTYAVVQSFLGTMPEKVALFSINNINIAKEAPKKSLVPIDYLVDWHRLNVVACKDLSSQYQQKVDSFLSNGLGFEGKPGSEFAGLCGSLKKGGDTGMSLPYLVRSDPEKFLAFHVSVGVDGAMRGHNYFEFRSVDILPE